MFKFFEAKINEKVEKAISDHNAKNDTKIHTSKVLFDIEQKAIHDTLAICKKIMYEYVAIMVLI